MKILNKFIWSKKEPSNKNDIWFDGSTWKMYTEEAWQSFTLPVDAADKVAKVLENASEVYQEKLNAGYGIIIEGNTISLDDSIKYDDSDVWEAIETLQQNKVEQIQLNDYVPLDRHTSTSQVLMDNISELNSIKLNKTDVATINGQSLTEGGNITIEGGESHNIGSIDLFEQIIAQKQNHDLTLEDKEAILNGKVITASVGNGAVPTISSNSMGENAVVLMFHFNERLYSMCVMWNNDRCYINGFFSFSVHTKLFADSELSETSENSVQNKVVTEKLTELDATKLESETVGTTEPTEDFEVNAEIKDKLAELSAEMEKIGLSQASWNIFDKDAEGILIGYYLLGTAVSDNPAYNTTDYMKVQPNENYSVSCLNASGSRIASTIWSANYFDKDKNPLSNERSLSGKFTTPEGCEFVRLTLQAAQWKGIMVAQGDHLQQLNDYKGAYIPASKTSLFDSARTPKLTINAGESIQLFQTYARKGIVVTARIQVPYGISENTKIIVGCGKGEYQGWYVEITKDNIEIFIRNASSASSVRGVIPHGLTLQTEMYFSIVAEADYKATYILESGGSVFKKSDFWHGGGRPYLENATSNLIYGALSYFNRDFDKKIWVYGDSYLSYTEATRWAYYFLRDWKWSNFLMSHIPGGTSADMYETLLNEASFGNPAYIVWCLGMNDGSDADANTPSASWLAYMEKFLQFCKDRGIEPILATIPTCSINNEGKNKWVKNSGYRYIDFALAVGADGNGNWSSGMLHSDKVHPTSAGAKALAARVLLDFPEITIL